MKYGVVGKISSGKDKVCELLEPFGYKTLKYSDVLKEILNSLGIKLDNRVVFQKLGSSLRNLFGSEVLSIAIINQSSNYNNVIANGIRSKGEFTCLKKAGFKIIGLLCDDDKRFERARVRKRFKEDKELTKEEFIKADEDPAEREVSKLINDSDIIISNNGTIKDLKESLIKELSL